jgi:hypothetical protein
MAPTTTTLITFERRPGVDQSGATRGVRRLRQKKMAIKTARNV